MFIMKKLLISIIFSTLCIGVYSQDSMNRKMDNKSDKMNKKLENPNDPMNKKIGNVPDSSKGKTLPAKPAPKRKPSSKPTGKKS